MEIKRKNKDKFLHVRIESQLLEAIQARADNRRIPLSRWIMLAIYELLQKEDKYL